MSTTEQLSTGLNRYKPTVNCTTVEVDQLLKDCSDLIQPTFAKWYAKSFYSLPPSKILELASQARSDGKQPAKLFSHLVKRYASTALDTTLALEYVSGS